MRSKHSAVSFFQRNTVKCLDNPNQRSYHALSYPLAEYDTTSTPSYVHTTLVLAPRKQFRQDKPSAKGQMEVADQRRDSRDNTGLILEHIPQEVR
mmetsp:Transcript_7603/g.16759  ORF Transcript_7603/g.16759 Transcript_7603/m.16759 type:complete len:95 (+) Transcript_7603:1-285(+)